MRRVAMIIAAVSLSACLQVYGPIKRGMTDETVASGPSATAPAGRSITLGNRKTDEIFDLTLAFFRQKGISVAVQDRASGIIAATGADESRASSWIDCSVITQTQNIEENYRVVAQIWRAGEGTNVAVQVNGIAGLTAADGNDKIKPAECTSTGLFEKDLLETLRK